LILKRKICKSKQAYLFFESDSKIIFVTYCVFCVTSLELSDKMLILAILQLVHSTKVIFILHLYNMAKQQAEASNPAAEKLKALQTTLERLDKTYGKGTVMRLSDSKVIDVPVISTGSLGLDLALGIGGVPRGRIVEVYIQNLLVKQL
jgi:hypothetical protein